MISKSKLKYIRSLELKKFRDEHRAFVAEGNKLVSDMLGAYESELIIAKPSWMATQGDIPTLELLEADEHDIRKGSFLKNPQDVIAVFKLPAYKLEEVDPSGEVVLALDCIQDPGNMGTIIRLAAWFGIGHIVCSMDTVDAFAPKTVQATMGSLAHVKIHYTDLEAYLTEWKNRDIPVYGTFPNEESIYSKQLSDKGFILMGNEGKGIRPSLESLITEKLCIPSYPENTDTAESLNVAIATAIVCAEFRRQHISKHR
ncbi:TrmH family RNA methyltransferase [Parabacteroides sp. PF5-5]|uniref:RNA methyltransferase n=1 Tax=unclassified Parabacteroides TaxID=2649774 RepID=UPI002474EE7E|nr:MULTISPECIES: RNA methyltransferase [unclassified Parabacteroides]MDH6316683.1 TrmH family RNA methyltransferase [Parabacteroides sp. PF5-13]MDH6327814.1 TrmH family RNA methyltransferase [Parabacteroides sp. PH5-41]MDH6335670.1 TrmH family RNA methyltransferase [Parabacteroides sp. PF5-5]MDH6346678.1 TrmH family RNA methyltransferase [Parabacteroides sp. PH5-46]MDH6361696.1 TrmH family RNA methyltransferase [Parabacteroides sp. PH5-16]